MSNILGSNQAVRVTTGFMNTVNDPVPGQLRASPSGSIIQPYTGLVGAIITLDEAQANALSDTTVGTLHAGMYQYVRFLDAPTARGQLVFWSAMGTFTVTGIAAAANLGKVAGVVITAATLPAAGNYGFIQIAGRASVLFSAAITKVGVADGDLVVVDQTPANTCDVLADATGLTSPLEKSIVGVANALPVAGAVSEVVLRGFPPHIGQ